MRDARDLRDERQATPARPIEPAEAGSAAGIPATRRRVGSGDGAIGGLLAGIAMGLAAMIVALVAGRGVFAPMALISATVYGEAALARAGLDAGPVIVGTVIHLVVSAGLGAVYGAFVGPLWSRAAIAGWAVAYALIVWVVAELAVLPALNPVMGESMPALLFAASHVVYGLVLGGCLAGRRGTLPAA